MEATPEGFQPLWEQKKLCRLTADGDYQQGDFAIVRERKPDESGADGFTGREVGVSLRHVARGEPHGVPEGMVLLTFTIESRHSVSSRFPRVKP